ncbi:MAG TPA: Fe-Mn family superoxide dismutase [Planctomycetota bacterium]|nr:Fe-Mn family superoxide dismutase [Planctomycetota bacterium]
MNPNRREVLTSLSLGGAAAALPGFRLQEPRARPSPHEVKPLPFDPGKLHGLSEKLVVSHHDNNYAGAVRNLNKVEAELGGVTKDTPGFVVAGLAERALTFRNSAMLHELYFGNLGGDGKLDGDVAAALAAAFGSMARFEELFRATAMSLAGGSGWVVLGHDSHRDELVVNWSGAHSQCLGAAMPLLVLDMYEHSYHMDYGAAAAKYVDAFFANIRGEEVDRRHSAARKAVAAMRR